MKRLGAPLAVAAAVLGLVYLMFTNSGPSSSLPRDPMTGKTEFNIPVQDPVLVAEGEKLYQASCAACHGSDLRGTAIGPSHLSVIYNPDHHADGGIALVAINGVKAHHWRFGDMPPVPGITQDDMVRIIAFIRESQRVQGFEAYPPR